MALKIWLPLNGDLRNQGIADVMVTNNGATVDNNGKMGKCYSFDGSDDGIRLDGDAIPALQQNDFSICFWVYNNDSGGRSIYIATTPASDFGFSIEKTTSEQLRVYWQANPDYVVSNFIIPNQEWCHIAMIIKNGNCYCYKNGEKVAERTNSDMTPAKLSRIWVYAQLGRDARTGTTVLNGKMNDFRWYDHALSPMEVKQISQGLVLHYRLSGVGGENIIPNSRTMALGSTNASTGTWRVAGSNTMTKSRITIDDSPIGECYGFQNEGIQTPNDGSCYGIDGFPFEANTDYTISMWARIVSGSEGYAGFNIFNIANEDFPHDWTLMKNYRCTTLPSDGNWKRCVYTFTTNSNTNRNIYIGIVTGDTNVTTQMCGVKIEKGLKITPWQPNPSDSEYSTMGLDDEIEYDCSGFGNNGTKTGTIASDTDTARYTTSYYFNGSSYISSANASFSWFNFDCGTLSAWIKPTVSISGWSGSIGIQADASQYFKSFCLTDFDNQFRVTTANGSWTTLSSGKTIPLNEWTHIAATLDGTTLKMYFNGELVSTQTVTWNSATVSEITKFAVAVDLPGADEKFTGNISDARFYSTALSPSDILALYNLGGSLDSNGTFHTYEYVEG